MLKPLQQPPSDTKMHVRSTASSTPYLPRTTNPFFLSSIISTAIFIGRHCISPWPQQYFRCPVLGICRFLAWAMDISSALKQNCCFKLAYSVLQFVLFVLSTQAQIIAAGKNILLEVKATASQADSLGNNLHSKWSLRPSVSFRTRWLLHSRPNRGFFMEEGIPVMRQVCETLWQHRLRDGREHWTIIASVIIHTHHNRQAPPALFLKFGVNVNTSVQLQQNTNWGCTRDINWSSATKKKDLNKLKISQAEPLETTTGSKNLCALSLVIKHTERCGIHIGPVRRCILLSVVTFTRCILITAC